ncbi:MAG: hypothetical protein C4527_14285 [Candidatus Omnitrophota bacterium]|jgi:hypothetical protein|nr:MAG: hypothetical protein C4527_14285 [Candidatus Omnitrophota bacterium]
MPYTRFDSHHIRVFPLHRRKHLTALVDILIDPDSPPTPMDDYRDAIEKLVSHIRRARESGASVMLMYGAHLIRNGMGPTLIRLMEEGWLTHLATNGAGIIHDWEYSFIGQSTESVRENVHDGTFGTWEETGLAINLAFVAGAVENRGLGESIGWLIHNDGVMIPQREDLIQRIRENPDDPLTPARADYAQWLKQAGIAAGEYKLSHPYKQYSVLANAFRLGVPFTVHPGIGYDIYSNHPLFAPPAIGRGAGIDYGVFVQSVLNLSNGALLSVGSAIMAPQVFEKSMSLANNFYLQKGRRIKNHRIAVVDLQDGGGWDWTRGEPPKTNAAYYLRFCKSFCRMGGELMYFCLDNRAFIHNLYHALRA